MPYPGYQQAVRVIREEVDRIEWALIDTCRAKRTHSSCVGWRRLAKPRDCGTSGQVAAITGFLPPDEPDGEGRFRYRMSLEQWQVEEAWPVAP